MLLILMLSWDRDLFNSLIQFPSMLHPLTRQSLLLLLYCLVIPFLWACSLSPPPEKSPSVEDPIADLLQETAIPVAASGTSLQKMGFSAQVGAFTQLENAVRLEQTLDNRGIDAYYFLHESGLYKVRFGNHANYADARKEAERLQREAVIERFFIVIPGDYAAARIQSSGQGDLRKELVTTARRFLGVPYLWGGEDRNNGFDCSGLTMVSYRLNGLDLPRNSRAQFQSGRNVAKKNLQQGDLVFFATKGGVRVTHVGIYIGDGKFIHAPRPGKTVRVASLSSTYFRKTYVGGRTYL